MEIRVAGKFKFIKKIGHGSFGEIFQAANIKTGEEVAVKLEVLTAKMPQL
jgi:hypothetical protein